MKLESEPDQPNSKTNIPNHGILQPLNKQRIVYGLGAQARLKAAMSAYPGPGEGPADSSSGIFQYDHRFTFP